ncbi:MAG: hypothetical protein JW850_18765 [Thermoflexales bacterium]|nr:hypothetical protein [Thermoflexales bacterium]
MKKTIAILGGVVGVLVVLSLLGALWVGSVFAQEPTPPVTDSSTCPCGGAGGGLRGGFMQEQVAKALGMTTEELVEARADGQTLAEIAKEKGVDEQSVIDAMLAAPKDALALALKYERVSQEQAAWVEKAMETMAPLMLTNPFGPGQAGGQWGGFMHGGMGGKIRGRMMGGGRWGGGQDWQQPSAPTE